MSGLVGPVRRGGVRQGARGGRRGAPSWRVLGVVVGVSVRGGTGLCLQAPLCRRVLRSTGRGLDEVAQVRSRVDGSKIRSIRKVSAYFIATRPRTRRPWLSPPSARVGCGPKRIASIPMVRNARLLPLLVPRRRLFVGGSDGGDRCERPCSQARGPIQQACRSQVHTARACAFSLELTSGCLRLSG